MSDNLVGSWSARRKHEIGRRKRTGILVGCLTLGKVVGRSTE